jgi:NitT/TauT family transport system substrate-binding protein/sulfonate transport system substrate-binding protein
MQPTPEAFIVHQMIAEGIDKKSDFAMEMIYADSGVSQIEALPAKTWDLANLGGTPMLMGALRYQAYMIALTADDGYNNMVMVRPNSPILQVKGFNPAYPELYGSPESVKGKTILLPTVTAAHYAAYGWLQALKLNDKDVVLQNMEPGQAMSAFESGVGDVVVVWVPFSLTGVAKGWKIVADGAMTKASVPLVWTTSKEFGDKNPDIVKRFMRLYFEQVDRYQSELKNNRPELVAKVRKMFTDWAGMEMETPMVDMMLETYKMFDLKQNLKMLDAAAKESEAFVMMKNVAGFFTENKRFTQAEKDQVLKTNFITDKFIK